MRRAAKIDANHGDIVEALRGIGCSVLSLAPLGKGAPDLLVGYWGRNTILEVKDGSKPPSKRKMTPDEEAFAEAWRGQYAVVETVEQAIEAVTA